MPKKERNAPTKLQEMKMTRSKTETDAIVIDEVQLLLSEKRTSLSIMRTGIAVMAIPLSILSVLVATSRNYDVTHVLYLLIPLAIVNFALVAFSIYLVVHAIKRMRRYDMMINEIKSKYSIIGKYID